MGTFPFDDQDMRYDYKTHKYTLTKECVFNELGINLDTRLNVARNDNQSAAADIALKQISTHLYNFIYARTRNKQYIELLLAKYEPCRELLKQCLLNEVQYTITNGQFWNYAGVNLSDSGTIDINALRGARVVSYDTEQILYQPLPNGAVLLYQGSYNVPKFEPYTDY